MWAILLTARGKWKNLWPLRISVRVSRRSTERKVERVAKAILLSNYKMSTWKHLIQLKNGWKSQKNYHSDEFPNTIGGMRLVEHDWWNTIGGTQLVEHNWWNTIGAMMERLFFSFLTSSSVNFISRRTPRAMFESMNAEYFDFCYQAFHGSIKLELWYLFFPL